MRKKLFTLLLAVAASVGTMLAEKVQIGDLYYNLDATNQTAEVAILNSASGEIIIPASVTYNSVSYSVTSIGEYAFFDCSGLTSVTIPNSVTSIGEYAFAGCSKLTSVTIGNSVTSIGNYAFAGCSKLASVTIGNSVTSIGEHAFSQCSGLTSVTIPNSVTSIGEGAFQSCRGLTSVAIPNSVTSIGEAAFAYCTGLTSINVASDNSNYCSVDGVLFNKDKTTLIQYPEGKQGAYTIPNSVTSIKDGAFAVCTGLTSVTIPNSVTSIGDGAFVYCTDLTSIIVENGNSFYDSRNNCNAIIKTATNTLIVGCKNTIIPNSVTSIGEAAFAYCTGLTSVTIPNSVTSIGEYAFSQCSGLTSVTIGNSVTSIGREAFYQCSGLTSITCEVATPPTLGSYVFSETNNCPIYVPCNSVSTYKSDWSEYASRILASPNCVQPQPETDNYVVLAQRNATSNWFYMTSDLGTAANKRYQAVDAGTTSLANVNTSNLESKYYWQIEENKLHTAAGYSTWESGNTAILDETGKELNIEKQTDGTYTFSFADGTNTRYLSLNTTVGNNYFAYYRGTNQIYKLTLVKEGERGTTTAIEEIASQQETQSATKVLRNGQIYILRGNKTYTLQGQEVR